MQPESLQYALAECPLGWLLVATSEHGIAAILLGDEPRRLFFQLEARFPEATLKASEPECIGAMDDIVRAVDHPELAGKLTTLLDIRGTPFQRRVWDAVREIQPGETASYAEVADHIGMPLAARAVGNACGKNAHAIVIPCHRVIASDGGLGGYGWGLEMKRRLLERERR